MKSSTDPYTSPDSFWPSSGGNPVAEAIRSRRTIHNFKPDLPPKEVITEAVSLARWAPNHKLTEPWRFRLLGRETADALAHLNAEIVAAEKGEGAARNKLERWLEVPGWLAVTCVRHDNPLRAKEDYAACACAVQNLMLYLWTQGIGVKWTTGDVTRHPRFFELLGMDPEREEFVGLLWYGYPLEVPDCSRRETSEILQELP